MKRSKEAISPACEKLNVSGISDPVEVRRHPKARRMTLRVSRARRMVVVTLPMQCDLVEAGTFVETHAEWVREHLGSIPQPVPFANRAVIPFRGLPHLVHLVDRCPGGGVVAIDDSAQPHTLIVTGGAERGPRRLTDWLIEQARRDLDASVTFHAERLKLRPKRIAVRDQSSRWGSCSTTGVLSFSWRLILAPPFVLDYVAAHEVVHLAEMNHGKGFWKLLRSTAPRTDEACRWLRHYGMDLHRYGAV